jgi:hypothetical protein
MDNIDLALSEARKSRRPVLARDAKKSNIDPPDRTAYKGYSIIRDLRGDWHVSKDGHHITTQSSLETAKKQIDAVVGDDNERLDFKS